MKKSIEFCEKKVIVGMNFFLNKKTRRSVDQITSDGFFSLERNYFKIIVSFWLFLRDSTSRIPIKPLFLAQGQCLLQWMNHGENLQ